MIDRQRCKIEVHDPEIRRVRARNHEPMICNLAAHYLIDGVPMCRRHAGAAALEKLIKGERPNVGRIAAAVLAAVLAVAVDICPPSPTLSPAFSAAYLDDDDEKSRTPRRCADRV